MTTMFIERITIKDLEDTIANSTPLLALVGAGDLAVEKLRAARDELALRAGSFDPKAVRDQAQASVAGRVETLQSELFSAPERIQALPEKAQEWPAMAQSLFADVLSAAFSTYGELAGRGKTRVNQVRREVPAGVEVEVKPVSRPAPAARTTSTTTTRTTSTRTAGTRTAGTRSAGTRAAAKKPVAKKPVAKKTTTSTTTTTSKPARKTATKAAAKKGAAKRTTAKRQATAKSTTAKSTTASTSTAKSTAPATKAVDTHS